MYFLIITGNDDYEWTCGFEDEALCGMIQSQSDNFNWTRQTGRTPSDPTGPDSAESGLYYMYLEASRKPKDAFAM